MPGSNWVVYVEKGHLETKAFFKLGGVGARHVSNWSKEFFQANILYNRENECETLSIICGYFSLLNGPI